MHKRIIRVGDIILDKNDKLEINKVLDSGRLSEGPRVKEFEKCWAQYIETKYAVCTSSGFGALMVALAALKHFYELPDGTEVITSPSTYIADYSAIYWSRFNPVFIDVNPDNFCLDEKKLKQYLCGSRTKGRKRILLTIDLFGYMNDIDDIRNICRENDLIFFEDAAEAHGSLYKGHKAGSQADISIFSFYIAHNIQVGEMGAVNTNNRQLAQLCRSLKAQGRNCRCEVCKRAEGKCPDMESSGTDPRFTHDLIGFNFKTTEFQGAIGLSQLKKADAIFKQRSKNVRCLNQGLSKFSSILKLPEYREDISYLAYPVVIRDRKRISRRQICDQLSSFGIESRNIFGSIPNQQPAAQKIFSGKYAGALPNADFLGENGFYIGCHQYLMKEDLDYIIEAFEKILGEKH